MTIARRLVAGLAAVIVFAGGSMAAEDTMTLGRTLSVDFREGRMQTLWDRMTPQMREALGRIEALEDVRAAVAEQFGAERTLLSEEEGEAQGHRLYLRTAQHEKGAAPLVTRFAFDADGRIAGFFVRPRQQAAESRFFDYRTKTDLRLPFDGEWFVYWGGRTLEENYHAVDAGQRFATDFVVMRDGASHAGDPQALDSYHCWDRVILAPANATVAAVVDGLPDQAIGEADPQHPAGNHVVLDFGDGEYGFLAHLRQGSIEVRQGDTVAAGAEIGRCGNSGNASEPHLHFHLQTTPVLGAGEGLPAAFVDYVANGKAVERGEPVRGEIISPADRD